jgi:hypothetical protein
VKRCIDCGAQQERWRDKQSGQEKTNLDPVSQRCLDCLAKSSKAVTRVPETAGWIDHRAKAARNDE